MSYKKNVWKTGDVITADGMNQMESGITSASDVATAARSAAEANAAKIEEGSLKDTAQDSAITEAASAAAAAQVTADAAKAVADANAKSIDSRKEKDEQQDASISANAEKNTAQDESIAEAKSAADAAAEAASNAQTTADVNTAKIEAGVQKDAEQDTAITAAASTASSAAEAALANAVKITSLETKAAEHDASLNAVLENTVKIASLETRANGCDDNFASMQTTLTNYGETITAQGEAVNGHAAKIASLETSIGEMSTSIEALNSNMQTLSANDATLQEADITLQKNIDDVIASAKTNAGAIESLKGDVKNAQGAADNAQTTADSAKADAAAAYSTAKSAGDLAASNAERSTEHDQTLVIVDAHLAKHDTQISNQDAQAIIAQQKILLLEQQLIALKMKASVSNDLTEGSTITSDEDLVIIPASAITEVTNVTAKSVTLSSAAVESSRVALTATNGDVTVDGITMAGSLEKSVSNAALIANSNGGIVKISNGDFDQLGYNAIEVGSAQVPSDVLIENIDFKAVLNNNAINVFGMKDGGVLTISNCHFTNCSNPIRISNKLNTSFTINVINCTVDAWTTTAPYAGLFIFQDYTSVGTAEEVAVMNQFGPSKIKINIINCTGPKGKLTEPADPSKVYGSRTNDQIVYVYTDVEGFIDYDENRYPEITYR